MGRLSKASSSTLSKERDSTDKTNIKGMNYTSYQMTLECKYPSGFPIRLRYPNITIDDKWALSFWRNQTEIEDFYLEQAAL